jgi:hypothetical protein
VSGPQEPPDHRAAAHLYLERGFCPVGWVIIDGRKAAVSMKGRHYADYSVTHADIGRWPGHWQVGLAMCQRSGFWALDFDCGQERAEEFFGHWVVTPTATQLTARGFHLVYRGAGYGNSWPRDGIWSDKWPDVQVRSNGFIAAWPSVHPSGAQYRWRDGLVPVEPAQLLLANRPERVPRPGGSNGRANRDGGPDGDLAAYAEHGIPMGWQDSELHRLACRHVRTMGHGELFGWLWAAVTASAQNPGNPWRPEDVAAKIRRAAEFAQREDAAAMAAWQQWQEART